MMTEVIDVGELKKTLKEWAADRDWCKFHSPKNIAMAIAGEVGELVEILQWMTEQESLLAKEDVELKQQISHELADILLYAVRMADVLEINLHKALQDKMEINTLRYPSSVVKGNAKKYTQYRKDEELAAE